MCLGSTAQFVCSATNTVSYLLKSMVVQNPFPYAYMSAPKYIGSITVVNITIFNAPGETLVTCHAYLVSGPVLTSTAYLKTQGKLYMYKQGIELPPRGNMLRGGPPHKPHSSPCSYGTFFNMACGGFAKLPEGG